MFSNFAWSEILVIVCVAIIVVGPKDLPAMLRTFGKTIGGIKRMAGDFQRQVSDAIRDSELEELKDMTSTKGFGPLEDAKKSMEDFTKSMNAPVPSEPASEETTPKPEAEAKSKPAPKKAAPKKPATRKAPTKKAAAKKAPASKATASKPAPKKRAAASKTSVKSTT